MTQAAPPEDLTMQRSSRDVSDLPARLAEWLAGLLPAGAAPSVQLLGGIDANGLSSETLTLDVTWTEDGAGRTAGYVARVAPTRGGPAGVPRRTRCRTSTRSMRLVAELTDVPVPAVRWQEPTGDVLGTPFFLMDRVEGLVPPDVLPYNFGDNWLFDAPPEQQRALQDATVDVAREAPRDPGRRARRSRSSTRGHGDTRARRDLAWTRALVRLRRARHRPVAAGGAGPRLARGRTCPGRPTRPCCAGATRGSATCSTGTSRRSASSTGRWRRSDRASST